MPELPEVEVCRRQLERWASGRVVHAVDVVDPAVVRRGLSTRPGDAVDGGAQALTSAAAGGVAGVPLRHGKRLGWQLGSAAVLVHLGMTGKWVRTDRAAAPPRFARLALTVDDQVLWFLDMRRFGSVTPVDPPLAAAVRVGLGPDALAEAPDGSALQERLTGRRPIKVALMDQARLAGVGNIHAAEALWWAAISPERRCEQVSAPSWERLAHELPMHLQRTVDLEDAEEIVYMTEGAENRFTVYGRAGEPCPRCGGSIARTRQSGRATYWCPGCQLG